MLLVCISAPITFSAVSWPILYTGISIYAMKEEKNSAIGHFLKTNFLPVAIIYHMSIGRVKMENIKIVFRMYAYSMAIFGINAINGSSFIIYAVTGICPAM